MRANSPLDELVASNTFEHNPEVEAAQLICNVPPPMRAFSLARSYFGGQKRPSDGTSHAVLSSPSSSLDGAGEFVQVAQAIKDETPDVVDAALHGLWGLAYRSDSGVSDIADSM
jgi:hypothetical protein